MAPDDTTEHDDVRNAALEEAMRAEPATAEDPNPSELASMRKVVEAARQALEETLPQAEGCWGNHYGDNPEGSEVPSHIQKMRSALRDIIDLIGK